MQPRKRILIVDDDLGVREVLFRWLGTRGYACMVAKNGEEALGLLDKEGFDAVLCDIRMPGVSGLEVLDEVKRKDPLALVIMATAVDDVDTAVGAMQAGAYDYVVKPFDLEKLTSVLQGGLKWKDEQVRKVEAAQSREARTMESALAAVRAFLQSSNAVPEALKRHTEQVSEVAVALAQKLGLSRLDTSIVA